MDASPSPPVAPSSPSLGPCSLCTSPAPLRCGRYKLRLYCSPPCQRSDWAAGHKAACRAITASSSSPSASGASTSGAAAADPPPRAQSCVGCDAPIPPGASAERCEGCGVIYCTGRCRVSHWPSHMAACVAGADAGAGATAETLVSRLCVLRQMKGSDHDDTLRAMSALARVLRQTGEVSDSEALRLEVMERRQRVWGSSDRSTPAPIDPCDVCGTSKAVLCGRCRSRAYCGRPCQLSDYAGHKAACKAIATSLEAVASSAGADDADMASVERGEWVCVGSSKVIVSTDEFERCQGCLSKYCTGHCRVTHWSEHKAACIPAAVARMAAGEGSVGAMEAPLTHRLFVARRDKGDDHGDTLTAVRDLAEMLLQKGRYRESEALYREALERCQRLAGEDHPNTLTALGDLAAVLLQQGQYGEAHPLSLRALEGKRRVRGSEHKETICSANNHALLLRYMGKHHDSEALYRSTLVITRRVLGNEHRATLVSLGGLALSLKDLGRVDECEPLFCNSLKMSRRVLGSDHPDSLAAISNFASLLRARRRFDEAEPLFREVLATSRRIHPPNHPDLLTAAKNLGLLLRDIRRWDEAEVLLEEALAGFTATPGEGHLVTRETTVALEELRRRCGSGRGR